MTLTTQQLEPIKIARYSFTLRARHDAILPPFLGSTLRGAFGHALKEVACSVPHGDCRKCLLVDRCAYPRLFETAQSNSQGLLKNGQQAPRPFIFVPPPPGPPQGVRARDDLLTWRMGVGAGQSLAFGLTLIGEGIHDLPYVIYAVGLMAHKGLGVDRVPFEMEHVEVLDLEGELKRVYAPGMSRVRDHADCHVTLRTLTETRLAELEQSQVGRAVAGGGNSVRRQDTAVSLRFLSPTRLRLKGEVIESPSFSQLITSLSLRLSMVAESICPLDYDYQELRERASQVSAGNSTLRMIYLDRYSDRRSTKLALDGFMGEITFRDPRISEFLLLLLAGEHLNVGSATAFGLGRYRVTM
jgi:hypothetical protein